MTAPARFRTYPLIAFLCVATVPVLQATPDQQEVRTAISALASYREGAPRDAVITIEHLVDATAGSPLREPLERGLAQLLLSDAAPASKRVACATLGRIGTDTSLPTLGRLLLEHRTTNMVAEALLTHSSRGVEKTLREALVKLDGRRRLSIIQVLGKRRERRAAGAIAQLTDDADPVISAAAIAALGRIATPEAITTLDALRSIPSVAATEASRASLVAARECTRGGRRSEAARLYAALVADGKTSTGVRRSARAALRELSRKTDLAGDFHTAAPVSLFDGETLKGWEGNPEFFRVEHGAIVAGSLERRIPHNEFLCTERVFGDFELRLQVKLSGAGDNAGIQFRSLRVPNHHEVSGYQADMGTGWWGFLYDESRRNRPLCAPDATALERVLRPDGWNDYVIRCVGPRIQLELNGLLTVDFIEPDVSIRRRGIIGLQIHGGAPSEASYRNIVLRELTAQ